MELYHYGTPGMKWYRRLYQNKDGSLTQLGRIRYRKNAQSRKLEAQKAKSENKTVSKSTNNVDDAKSQKEYIINRMNLRRLNLSELDDQTLNRLKQRLQIEKDVTDLINTLSPPKKHAIRKYIKQVGGTAMTTVGQQVSTYMLARFVNALAMKAGADGPIVSGKKGK